MNHSETDYRKTPLTEIYGIHVFNDSVMRQRLPKPVYNQLKEVQQGKRELSLEVAEVVASAMKDWAIEKGATHYTHWFQPLTDLTAEKHDAFISPTDDGKVIMEFSGAELIMGEPDASSFPSGGLRATFEARGYTAWDTTSPAYLKEDKTGITLYIPTAFISYRGETLDKKVPLLRSMQAVGTQAMRVLKALGNTTAERVITSVGPEQEYFLVDKEFYDRRPDLIITGRTIFGAAPSKGQELDDHYFGSIKERVAGFMHELNNDLWKLGISAKTQHNEVAPNQFELATIYNTANVATDHNQIVMETLQKVASRHKLVALLHEKPFKDFNGSGKHNNWSLATDDGVNLLEPGDNPHSNAQFLLFLTAVIKAVDTYAPLLRMSAANTGNDHRLGGHEAPPAIISIFLGDILSEVLEKLAADKPVNATNGSSLEIGVSTLPKLPKHLTDRNRTSPFAFTGNKFEFRMVPSSQSIAEANTILNSTVAAVLEEFADSLEADIKAGKDINEAVAKLIKETYKTHSRVVFNGNGYSEEWVQEAEQRGLPNIKSTVDAIGATTTDSAVKLFEGQKVYSKEELESRQEICYEKFSKQVAIEANVMLSMARKSIIPAANRYAGELARTAQSVHAVDPQLDVTGQTTLLKSVLGALKSLETELTALEQMLTEAMNLPEGSFEQARFYRYRVFEKMNDLRSYGDRLEQLVAKDLWPFPTYEDMLMQL
ncbi:MAG: glutamine synthetase III [Spirochaetia bacterium]|nr:glutamine synthetase III [Spirochaetia bacterium]